jgi:hypothetical protein
MSGLPAASRYKDNSCGRNHDSSNDWEAIRTSPGHLSARVRGTPAFVGPAPACATIRRRDRHNASTTIALTRASLDAVARISVATDVTRAGLRTPGGRCTDGFEGNSGSSMQKPAAALPGGLSRHTPRACPKTRCCDGHRQG